MTYTGDPYLDAELVRVTTAHPDILSDDESFLHYQQEVVNARGDFDAAYEEFARVQAELALAMIQGREVQQAEARTPAERQTQAVASHLRDQARRTQ